MSTKHPKNPDAPAGGTATVDAQRAELGAKKLEAELATLEPDELEAKLAELGTKHAEELAAQRAELEAQHMKALDDERQKHLASLRELEETHNKDVAAHRIELEQMQKGTEPSPAAKPAPVRIPAAANAREKAPPKRVRPPAPFPGAVLITRQTLRDAHACQTHTFEKHVGDAEGFYWTKDEVLRLYKQDPRHLAFYEARGLVPLLEVEGVPSASARKAQYEAARKRRAGERATLVRSLPFART
jgi:hypothetical protein